MFVIMFVDLRPIRISILSLKLNIVLISETLEATTDKLTERINILNPRVDQISSNIEVCVVLDFRSDIQLEGYLYSEFK